ncbi:hypothetical protein V490_01375 [Pseudogymnoascus sp. VKM F-3557]|nr:hypothetical protein V490_01375 [Pseudogymnoascus sp. VKM F-3557]
MDEVEGVRDAPKTDDKEVEEDELFPGFEEGEKARKLVSCSEEVEVAEQHAPDEHGEEGAVDNVHEIVDQAQLAPQAGVLAAAREGHDGCVDDNRALELHGDRPHVAVVVEPRLPAAVEDEGEVLEVAVPLQELISVGSLVLRVGPDAQRVPGRHVDKGRYDDGDVEAHPAAEQRRRNIIPQLAILPGLDQAERLRCEHIPGNNEEYSNGKVAAGEKGADKRQRRKVVLVVVAKGVFEDLVGIEGVARPQVVMLPVDQEGREAAQAVEVGGAAELFLGLAAAGACEEGRAQVFSPVLGDARNGRELVDGVGGNPFLAQEAVVLEGHFWRRGGEVGRSRLTAGGGKLKPLSN